MKKTGFYATGFAFIVLGGAFLSIWNIKTLGYILAVIGIIIAGFGSFLGE